MEIAAAWFDKARLTGSPCTPPGGHWSDRLLQLQYGDHGQDNGV